MNNPRENALTDTGNGRFCLKWGLRLAGAIWFLALLLVYYFRFLLWLLHTYSGKIW